MVPHPHNLTDGDLLTTPSKKTTTRFKSMPTMDMFANSVHKSTVAGRCRWFPRSRALRGKRAAHLRGDELRSSSAGFSLVEVAMSVGIMGFAFVAILGLVPVALTSFRDTKTAGISSQISQQIIAEAQVAPFSALTQTTGNSTVVSITSQGVTYAALCLPAPAQTPASYVRYFDDQGSEVLSTDPTAIYQVNSRVLVGPPFVQPGAAGGTANADVAGLTVQVAYNPDRLPLDMTAANDLWAGTANGGNVFVPILSFQTNVARNF